MNQGPGLFSAMPAGPEAQSQAAPTGTIVALPRRLPDDYEVSLISAFGISASKDFIAHFCNHYILLVQ